MTLTEARDGLKDAERKLKEARRKSKQGHPVSVSKAANLRDYWLTKVYMAWERER